LPTAAMAAAVQRQQAAVAMHGIHGQTGHTKLRISDELFIQGEPIQNLKKNEGSSHPLPAAASNGKQQQGKPEQLATWDPKATPLTVHKLLLES